MNNEQEMWDAFNEELDRLLRKMVKHEHLSIGVDSRGEIVFWCTDENAKKFEKEKHLYQEG